MEPHAGGYKSRQYAGRYFLLSRSGKAVVFIVLGTRHFLAAHCNTLPEIG